VTDTREPYDDDLGFPRNGHPQLEINVQPAGADRCWVTVRGELDIATAGQLATALSAQLANGHHVVCLDLAGLSFCGAAGLNMLLAVHRAHQAAHGTLILARCSPQVARVLRLTGLDSVLTIETEKPEPYPSLWWG
jgi:anti-anti-sigma factor